MHILAFADNHHGKIGGQGHRYIFHRMHGDVGPPFFHGNFKLLDEQALAADLRERSVENLVAFRRHADDVNHGSGIELAQFCRRPLALRHGEAAFT